ncbi:major facilitator superfamily domain-containing protein 6-like [Stegodyphus dumicola]|uniref:major facilitator superfamily domain-containing protein 6-like n=1 Tax=Stegodyphus dumicola TaxID=202533 RepID=UPI0015B0CBF1|nr:major facilitator superfamily domain-containing protein 6-like [Stegodyphus dumicola]
MISEMEFLKINRDLLPLKIHYMMLHGANAGVVFFLPVYAKQLGISANAVGIIYAVIFSITAITSPFIGSLVDHFQKMKSVLIFLMFISISAVLSLNFIPLPTKMNVNITNITLLCYETNSYLVDYEGRNCGHGICNSTNNCNSSCVLFKSRSKDYAKNEEGNFIKIVGEGVFHESLFNNYTNSTKIFLKCSLGDSICAENCHSTEYFDQTSETNQLQQLCLFSGLVAIAYTAYGSLISLSDAACYNALGTQPHLYGKQRMWGTIAWGPLSALIGFLNDIFTGTSNVYDFSAGFYLFAILLIIDMPIVNKLHLKPAERSKNICKDVGKLLVKLRIILFILCCFFIGTATGLSRTYLFWYLRTLHASQLILGLVVAVMCFLGELPFFFFSGWIINKIGHVNTFLMAFIAFGLKFIFYSFLTNPWLALPIEILQGACYGSFYAAMTSYAKIVAPKGTEATAQGLASGAFEGLGIAAGSLLGGFGFTFLGGRKTLFWAGVLCIFCGLLHYAIHMTTNSKNTDPGK